MSSDLRSRATVLLGLAFYLGVPLIALAGVVVFLIVAGVSDAS